MRGSACPGESELIGWLLDPAADDANSSVAAHLDACGRCQESLWRRLELESDTTVAAEGGSLLADLRHRPSADPLESEPEYAIARGLAEAARLGLTATGPACPSPRAGGDPPLPRVENYEVLGVLGRGGMGVVYQARHTSLNRPAAIKMILGGKYTDPVAQTRFLLEAEVIARLRHPHVVQVFEFGRCDDQPYFVLEYVGGGSLAGKLQADGRFAPRAAAATAAKLADAMTAAHAQGVVHRDLKPANVLLTEAGEPKVSDFGLAKVGDSGATATGSVMGTPSYMAPEQAAGKTKEVGAAADVYALGAILYALLTGRPPFAADTAIHTIQQVLTTDPARPRSLVPGVPRDLETICLKCLEKAPERRYPSAAALADDLGRYLRGKPIVARAVGPIERAVMWVKRNPVVTVATAAVVLAMAAGTTVSFLKYRDAERQKVIAEERRTDAEAKEAEARREAEKASRARDFLVSIFELSDPNNPQGAMNARRILADAERRIPNEFADQPELRAELLEAIDAIHSRLTADAPLAMILEARGEIGVHSPRNAAARAAPQTLLYSGDRLRLAAGAGVRLVFLSDLHQERLAPGREATVRRKGCEPAAAVTERTAEVLMPFVRLPKGSFYMGGGGGTAGTRAEVEEDFEISVHLVTQGQWQEVMGNNPSSFTRFGPDYVRVKDVSDEELKLFPVECVSGEDADRFIRKLNERTRGRGWTYRLPTEVEWEYACRAGGTSEEECAYHFYLAEPTNALSSAGANFDGRLPHGEAPKGRCLERPTRVGSYPPNRLGLCDMHGNVAQLCSDTRGDLQVQRGGAWGSDGFHCRAAERNLANQWDRSRGVGFRLVRVPAR